MTLPSANTFPDAVDGYADLVWQTLCDPIPKVGATAFAKLLTTQVGGTAGIGRDCNAPPTTKTGKSEHKEGRAIDWMNDINKPEEKARVEQVIAWLLAPDAQGNPHAMLRRAGVMYMIWDNKIWSVRTRSWVPYGGFSPHRDHIHFTLGWDGALGKTSLYRALGVEPQTVPYPVPRSGQQPVAPEPPEPEEPPTPPAPTPSAEAHPWSLLVGVALGVAGVMAWKKMRRRP